MSGEASVCLSTRFIDLDAHGCPTAQDEPGERHTHRRSVLDAACRELLDDLGLRRGGVVTRVTEPEGKPRLLLDAQACATGLSLAHSEGLGLAVLAEDAEVGTDLEALRPVIDRTALSRRLFTRSEQGWLAELTEAERDEGFLRLWTLKEAYLKATGEGLARPPASVSIGWDDAGCPSLCAVDNNSAAAKGWTLCMLNAPSGYVAAVAVRTGMALLA